ncbi:MAG: CoA-binding protein [Lachnotalea sp.]
MNIEEVMKQEVFVVVGDTINEEKYACKIKNQLIQNGYQAYGVGKEKLSINDVEEQIDIIDLCINPVRGLQLMKECNKTFKSVVIQPGAESPELVAYLQANNIPYIEGCLLVGLSLYSKNK